MQIRAETKAHRLKTRELRQNFQTFKSILNSGALFFSLDKDKKVKRISQVSNHDRSGVANVVEKYAQRRQHFARSPSKTRYNIRHLLHNRKKLISTRCLLATFHAHQSLMVRYLFEFHFLVFLGMKCSREILCPIRL